MSLFELILEQALFSFLYCVHVFPHMVYSGHSWGRILLIKMPHFPIDHYVKKLSIQDLRLEDNCYLGCKAWERTFFPRGSSPPYLGGGRNKGTACGAEAF